MEYKSYHKVRQFRISDKNYKKLLELKKKNKGTWNYTFTKIINQLNK